MHRCLLLAVDFACVVIANLFAIVVSAGFVASPAALTAIGLYALATAAFSIPALLGAGLNRTLWRFTSLNDCVRILLTVAIAVFAAVLSAGFAGCLNLVPPQLPALQVLLMSAALIGVRAVTRLRYARSHRRRRNAASSMRREDVILVGLNAVAELFLRCANETAVSRVTVAGILSEGDRHRGRLLGSCPILGRPEAIEIVLRDLEIHGVRIDRIIVAERFESLSASAQQALRKIEMDYDIPLDCLHRRFKLDNALSPHENPDAQMLPDIYAAHRSPNSSITHAAIQAYPTQHYLWWKRCFDVTFAAAGLALASPVILAVTLLVALDVGLPVIFWQQRPGAFGQPIRVFKLRTMRPARDAHGECLADADRLSRIGRLLRRTRLDELPQIYNVLLGQMSMIGPRPLLPVDQSPRFADRLSLKPGLTGWAQINGGRHLSSDDKAALDLWYVRHASFRLDVYILVRTVGTVLFGETINRSAIDAAWLELGGRLPRTAGDEQLGDVLPDDTPPNWRWLKPAQVRASTPSRETSAS